MIPTLPVFKVDTASFLIMLSLHLSLPIPGLPRVCKGCGARMDAFGRHWVDCRHVNEATRRHNKLRDTAFSMYSSGIGESVTKEPYGLLPATPDVRPGDLVAGPTVHGTSKAQAYDFVATDPTSKSALSRAGTLEPLNQAKWAEKEKIRLHDIQVREAGETADSVGYVKVPLAFETTGAMGPGTKKWWDTQVMPLYKRKFLGPPPSLSAQDKEHTWAANSFAAFWLQRFAMEQAKHVASTVWRAQLESGTLG